MARGMEGILYDVVFALRNKKEKQYARMPLKSVEQIYAAIEANIEDEYVYSKNTSVVILDSINGTTDLYEVTEETANIVNSLHSIARGTYLYDLYKSN